METKNLSQHKAINERYGRPQNIRVVLSSYLTELREGQYEKNRQEKTR